MNETYDPKVQVFTFYNPSGTVNNTCTITLEVWSPYFESPISITKFVTVGPPLQAEFTHEPHATGSASPPPLGARSTSRTHRPASPRPGNGTSATAATSTEQNPVHTLHGRAERDTRPSR